jgi:hypothetical protein
MIYDHSALPADGEGPMDDGIQVKGLETLWPADPHSGQPAPWRPNAPGMKPPPEGLRLVLQYHGETYEATMIRSEEGARWAGEKDETELHKWKRWFEHNVGWFVIVSGPQRRFSSSPYPTLEAAIVGALSLPRVSWLHQQ